jgi:hypothetical protein
MRNNIFSLSPEVLVTLTHINPRCKHDAFSLACWFEKPERTPLYNVGVTCKTRGRTEKYFRNNVALIERAEILHDAYTRQL